MSHVPHMHLIFMPTCFARSENCCAPTGVISSSTIANVASVTMAAIERTLIMTLSHSGGRGKPMRHWLCGHCQLLCAREHEHRAAIRQQCHQRSKHHHESAGEVDLVRRSRGGVWNAGGIVA